MAYRFGIVGPLFLIFIYYEALSMTTEPAPLSSPLVLLARLMWIMIGPASLFLLAGKMITNSHGWFTSIGAWFAATVFLTAFGRWFEQRSGAAIDTEGNVTTMEDCSRYIVRLLSLSLAAWLVSNILGNIVLK